MNPNATWTRPDPDEQFVAKFLERLGMKAVDKSAVVLDLGGAPYDRATTIETLRASSSDSAAWLADQIEAQTRPPKPPEPQGLGAVVEDAEGVRWTRVYAMPNRVAWKDAEGERLCAAWSDVDAVRVLSEGVTDA